MATKAPFSAIRMTGTSIDQMERFLLDLPDSMKQKALRKAIKKGTATFANAARRNARKNLGETARWGKEERVDLAKTVRRRHASDYLVETGTIAAVGQDRMYAAATEYGHRMFIPEKQAGGAYVAVDTGEQVHQKPWWRPAKVSTRSHIDNLVLKELQAFMRGVKSGIKSGTL